MKTRNVIFRSKGGKKRPQVAVITKHFVTFYSPGTFVSEETTKEIDSWDPKKAIEMAWDITERYGAIPYCFVFTTRSNDGTSLDSKETARSGRHFIGGKIYTRKQIENRRDPKDAILIDNMRINKIPPIVENTNSYKVCIPYEKGDVRHDVRFGRHSKTYMKKHRPQHTTS